MKNPPFPVTRTEVEDRVKDLASRGSDDPESLHSDEDDLYRAVLHTIASGDMDGWDAQQLAASVLRISDLDFPRWYA